MMRLFALYVRTNKFLIKTLTNYTYFLNQVKSNITLMALLRFKQRNG
jgi:hypothetical protein